MPVLNKGMRRRGQVDRLTSQHVQFLSRFAEPLEMRQVRMKIKRRQSIQEYNTIEFWLCLDRGRRAVRRGGGPQSKSILHRRAKPCEERARKAAKALLGWDRPVSVMKEIRFLQPQPFGV